MAAAGTTAAARETTDPRPDGRTPAGLRGLRPHSVTSRVLIVEDNDDLAHGLANNLEIEGFSVEISRDGARGLERIRTTRPDLLILDLMLPGMAGYRVLSTL